MILKMYSEFCKSGSAKLRLCYFCKVCEAGKVWCNGRGEQGTDALRCGRTEFCTMQNHSSAHRPSPYEKRKSCSVFTDRQTDKLFKSQEFSRNYRFLRIEFKFIRAGGASAPPECPLYYAKRLLPPCASCRRDRQPVSMKKRKQSAKEGNV